MTALDTRPPARTTSTPPTGRRLGALARHHARRVLRSPLTLGGLLLSVAVTAGALHLELHHLRALSVHTASLLLPLAAGVLVASHREAARADQEQVQVAHVAAMPRASQTIARAVGSLAVVPVAVLVVLTTLIVGYVVGGTGSPHLLEAAIGPVAVGLAGVVGVATARWLPDVTGAVVPLVVVAGSHAWIASETGRLGWLAVVRPLRGGLGRLDVPWVRPVGAHLVYLAALGLLLTALAVMRDDRRRAVPLLSLAAIAVLAAGSWQLRPVSDESVELVLAAVLDEELDCHPSAIGETCTTPSYDRHGLVLEDVAARIAAVVPAADRPELRLEVRAYPYPGPLLAEIAGDRGRAIAAVAHGRLETLRARQGEARDDVLRASAGPGPSETARVAIATAAASLALPPHLATSIAATPLDGAGRVEVCDVAGQARELAWILLAAEEPAFRRTLTPVEWTIELPSGPVDAELPWRQHGSIRTSEQLSLALPGVLELDDEHVRSIVSESWGRWTDPDTSLSALLDALGAPPPIDIDRYLADQGLDADEAEAVLAQWRNPMSHTDRDPYPPAAVDVCA